METPFRRNRNVILTNAIPESYRSYGRMTRLDIRQSPTQIMDYKEGSL